MIFIGNIEAKADDKGRVFVPAAYRKQLDSDLSIVVRKDPDNKCLMMYPRSVWESKVQTLRSSLNEWDPRDQMILMQFVSDAVCVEVDSQGRILIPSVLREFAALDKEVVLVGVGGRIEIWSKERWEEASEYDDMDDIAEHMSELGLMI